MSRTDVKPLTDAQQVQLGVLRALAMEQMPYMAAILYALRPLNAPGLGTYAVDDQLRLYIDFDGVAHESNQLGAESLLHECSHVLQDHATLAKELELAPGRAKVWNFAADCAINDDLRDAGCAELSAMGVLPGKLGMPDYLTAPDYYRRLMAKMPPEPDAQAGGGQGGSEGNGSPSDSGGDAGKGDQPFAGCGSISGGSPAPCELGSDSLGGAAAGASSVEKDRIRVVTSQAIANASASGQGSVPAGLVAYAESLLAPAKVDWRAELSRRLRGAVRVAAGGNSLSYVRRNARRHNERLLTADGTPGSRIVHPGKVHYKPSLVVVRDTSGSMDAAKKAATTNEIAGIAKALRVRGKDLLILDVDARVSASREYKNAASLFQSKGGGGTDMGIGITYALQMRPRPTAVIVITDGDTPWPEIRPSRAVPVIACLVGKAAEQSASRVPSWIHAVVVDD